MERKEAVKLESTNVGSPTFPEHVSDCYLDWYEAEKGPSLGFMELLGLQDNHFSSPLFDILQVQVASSHVVQPVLPPAALLPPSPVNVVAKIESTPSEFLNQPATPNSSSISSESSGALNDEVVAKAGDNEECPEQHKTKKELKPKKTNQKRQREPRFAFMTKSEVDHLEDGYRWRKYGQKAVKNSPFPRSYYRCTTASCNVKKRVERSFNDPSIVVTTYEGQHTHPSPVMPRPTFPGIASEPGFASTSFAMPMQRRSPLHQQHQQAFVNSLSSLGFAYNGTPNASFLQDRRFCVSTPGSGLLKDHGLLQDIVPSHMLKEE